MIGWKVDLLLEVSSNMKIKENKNRALIHSVVSVGISIVDWTQKVLYQNFMSLYVALFCHALAGMIGNLKIKRSFV